MRGCWGIDVKLGGCVGDEKIRDKMGVGCTSM